MNTAEVHIRLAVAYKLAGDQKSSNRERMKAEELDPVFAKAHLDWIENPAMQKKIIDQVLSPVE